MHRLGGVYVTFSAVFYVSTVYTAYTCAKNLCAHNALSSFVVESSCAHRRFARFTFHTSTKSRVLGLQALSTRHDDGSMFVSIATSGTHSTSQRALERVWRRQPCTHREHACSSSVVFDRYVDPVLAVHTWAVSLVLLIRCVQPG